MKTSTDTKGDLGEFIMVELERRGIVVSKPRELPKVPATWRIFTAATAASPRTLAATAQACSIAEVLGFCFALFSASREERPLSSDESFFFSIGGGSGHFSRTGTGLVVSFLAHQQVLTIRKYEHGIHIGFVDHDVA